MLYSSKLISRPGKKNIWESMWWFKNKGKSCCGRAGKMPCVFVGSSKACRGNSRELNKTALKAIPLLVYKLKDGVRANFLISTAWALQSRLFFFLIVTCTVSQLSVPAQKSAFTFTVASGTKGTYAHPAQSLLVVSDSRLLFNARDVLPEGSPGLFCTRESA